MVDQHYVGPPREMCSAQSAMLVAHLWANPRSIVGRDLNLTRANHGPWILGLLEKSPKSTETHPVTRRLAPDDGAPLSNIDNDKLLVMKLACLSSVFPKTSHLFPCNGRLLELLHLHLMQELNSVFFSLFNKSWMVITPPLHQNRDA